MRSTRRDFLKSAASAALVAGVASPTLIPRSALADGTRPGANDRIGVAGIGVGRRGSEIFASAARNPKAQAICVADVWLPRAENIAKKHKCDAAYQDYRRVLDRKDVDAVLTATPEHWRGLVCINACLAGKHVYGEKSRAQRRVGRRLNFGRFCLNQSSINGAKTRKSKRRVPGKGRRRFDLRSAPRKRLFSNDFAQIFDRARRLLHRAAFDA